MEDEDIEQYRRKRAQDEQALEQSFAFVGERLPAIWRLLYSNCIKEGFSETQALEIVKTYIQKPSGAM